MGDEEIASARDRITILIFSAYSAIYNRWVCGILNIIDCDVHEKNFVGTIDVQ